MANRVLGAFELEKQLGAGGMGVVYLARYVKTGQRVALKLLSPSLANDQKLVTRFQRELQILKKLKHPHIVQCYGGGRLGEQRFYVMELIEGGSLSEQLRAKKRFSWEQTIQYGLQICSALEHAHDNGIIHRDLKPANLMVDKNGQVKLADFGLARVTDATAITAAGKTLGTFAYMAPEQITGKSPITHKTDLYALGCVLYEFLTGKTPFQQDTTAELFYAHIKKKPARITAEALDCPIWLESIVLQLLEKDPDKRPRDSLAVHQALTEVSVKVAENAGVAQQTATGDPTSLSVPGDAQEVGALLKKKKKKKRNKHATFYEQTWFLVSCLLLLVGVVTWSVWPMGEEKLFAKASVLMASKDPVQWAEARDKFLVPLQKRFPDGAHAAQVQEYLDDIEMQATETKIKKKISKKDELKTEAERLFAEAWGYEQFGDRVMAIDKYNAMIHLLKDREEDRPYVSLARRQIAELESAGDSKNGRVDIVNAALENADKAFVNGDVIEARKTWSSILKLYEGNRELEPQVERARTRLFGPAPSMQSSGGVREEGGARAKTSEPRAEKSTGAEERDAPAESDPAESGEPGESAKADTESPEAR